VLGHNGAGKSTLLRAAVGLLTPQSGAVLLDGEDITRRKPHERVARGMAYVPQGQQAFPHLTTAENLQLVADGRRRCKEAIAEALDLFPALRALVGPPRGSALRWPAPATRLRRALVTDPRILLLDEPTEGIQPSVVAEIEGDDPRPGRPRGLSVLLVEQHVGFAMRAAQRYYVLEAGRVTSSGAGRTGGGGLRPRGHSACEAGSAPRGGRERPAGRLPARMPPPWLGLAARECHAGGRRGRRARPRSR